MHGLIICYTTPARGVTHPQQDTLKLFWPADPQPDQLQTLWEDMQAW